MISREDILNMDDDAIVHWWSDGRVSEINTTFNSYKEMIEFWMEFHRKFGKIILTLDNLYH